MSSASEPSRLLSSSALNTRRSRQRRQGAASHQEKKRPHVPSTTRASRPRRTPSTGRRGSRWRLTTIERFQASPTGAFLSSPLLSSPLASRHTHTHAHASHTHTCPRVMRMRMPTHHAHARAHTSHTCARPHITIHAQPAGSIDDEGTKIGVVLECLGVRTQPILTVELWGCRMCVA